MKKANLFTCMLFVSLFLPVSALAEVNFTMDIQPISFLFSSDVDGFRLSKTTGWSSITETIDGTASLMPNLKVGIGIDTGKVMHLDITAGAGYLYNSAFGASMICLDVAPRFKLGSVVTLAPHIGLIQFGDLEWNGNDYATSDDVTFSDGGSGVMYGVSITAGKKFAFVGSIDGISVEEYKVTTRNGWVANRRTLDISGVAVQLGVKFRF